MSRRLEFDVTGEPAEDIDLQLGINTHGSAKLTAWIAMSWSDADRLVAAIQREKEFCRRLKELPMGPERDDLVDRHFYPEKFKKSKVTKLQKSKVTKVQK